MKLQNIKEIKGKIKSITGLHIGSGDTEMKIGGTDKSVIKHPFTNEPYIPGSSIKGKIRSLLEMKYGLMGKTEGAPLKLEHIKLFENDTPEKKVCENILKLFGSGASSEKGYQKTALQLGPTRVSFGDAHVIKEKDRPLLEAKSENSINRITGTAENPRCIERVPSDTEFSLLISLKKLDEEPELEKLLIEGLKLLEMDSLGGSGSRGYGKIKFKFYDSDFQNKFDECKVF